jgi:hypothetical protein
MELHPLVDDEQLFAGSKFRFTRFRLVAPQFKVMGADLLGLLQGTTYRFHSVLVDGANLDLLLNKDGPYDESSPSPLMPNEILSSIKGIVQVDRLKINRGRLQYAERFVVGAKPAVVTFDNVKMLVEGITNRASHGAAIIIHTEANLMNSGTVKIDMSIPAASPELSLRYSGSLSTMDLNRINPFLEIAEHIRVKSGILHEATFDINVTDGHATGNVWGKYENFTIAVLNKRTGNENNVFDQVASLIANLTKFRRTNMPDKSGNMKVGIVDYTRKPNETFIQFVWPALRGGLGNVAGF